MKGGREEADLLPPVFHLPRRWRVDPRAASDGGAWGWRATSLLPLPLCRSGSPGLLFVFLIYVCVYLNLLYFFIIICKM